MPTASTRRVIRWTAQWIVGLIAGTLIIAVTSPLFVRSYAPLQVDPIRGVWTLPPGLDYRWRAEGYAVTLIGPLGMPGKRLDVDSNAVTSDVGDGLVRVALWGDSQAEGVCVTDHQKLHAQAEQIAAEQIGTGRWSVYPLARSGEDVAVWLTQMPAIESALSIDVHVLLVVDLPDLRSAPLAPLPPPSASAIGQANSAIASVLPAFMIQAARRLLTESDEITPRKLRFSVGPVDPQRDRGLMKPRPRLVNDWSLALGAIRRSTDLPLVILYAPKLPQIIDGTVITEDSHAADFEAMKSAAEAAGLIVVDLRGELLESMQLGRWPHGFHNGVIGSGHLNADGYSVVATRMVDAIGVKGIDVSEE